jgi:hypothetical protein
MSSPGLLHGPSTLGFPASWNLLPQPENWLIKESETDMRKSNTTAQKVSFSVTQISTISLRCSQQFPAHIQNYANEYEAATKRAHTLMVHDQIVNAFRPVTAAEILRPPVLVSYAFPL